MTACIPHLTPTTTLGLRCTLTTRTCLRYAPGCGRAGITTIRGQNITILTTTLGFEGKGHEFLLKEFLKKNTKFFI